MTERAPSFQFTNLEQQDEAATLGMWAFLATEVLFFGALVAGYFNYRVWFGQDFIDAARHTKVVLGTINTAILLTSSACMAMVVAAYEAGARRTAMIWLAATALLGLCFIGVKGWEYVLEYREQLVPVLDFSMARYGAVGEIFFLFYFCATGLHALHLLIGIGLVTGLIVAIRQDRIGSGGVVRMIGLYWHFVDIVWIFLFPLIYLAGRNG